MEWREFAADALRRAGPSRRDKAEALRAAGREWRRMKTTTGNRRNPGPNWLLLGALGVAGVVGYNYLRSKSLKRDERRIYGP